MSKCECKCEKKDCCCGFVKTPKFMVCFMSLMAAAVYTFGGFMTGRVKGSAVIKRFFFSAAGFMVGQCIAALLIPAKENNTED